MQGEGPGTPIFFLQDDPLILPSLAYSFLLNTLYYENQTVVFFLVFGSGLRGIYKESPIIFIEIRLVN